MSHLTFDAIFISDLHIGSDVTNYKKLFNFLENLECNRLFLVGDIIYRGIKDDDLNLKKLINILDSKDFETIYILGNHEKSHNQPLPPILANKKLHSSYIYKDILIEHGDSYDTKDKFLQTLKRVDKKTYIKLKNRRLKAALKKRIHKVLKAIAKLVLHGSFSKYMALKAKKNRCKAVVCGHFHKPYTTKIYDIDYFNCGDWIDNCTYIAEDFDGKLRLYKF